MQASRIPDRARLEELADTNGIPTAAVLAVAWIETHDNLDPHIRGHHCWWERKIFVGDVARKLVHHERNCEVGRFQIKPQTAIARCPGYDVFTYEGNLNCFAKMFGEDMEAKGVLFAITNHNGHGDLATEYLARALAVGGRIAFTGEP